MKYFIQVTLTTYIAAMLVYSLWGWVTFQTLDQGWVGSSCISATWVQGYFLLFFWSESAPSTLFSRDNWPYIGLG